MIPTSSHSAVGDGPLHVDFSPDGTRAYVVNSSSDTLSVFTFGPALPPLPAPTVTVTPTSGLITTESGGTANFLITLSEAPTDEVTIALTSSDPTEGTVSASAVLTTANWQTGVTVTVTGADDAVIDGPVGYTILTADTSSADPLFDGVTVSDVTVTNTDSGRTLPATGIPLLPGLQAAVVLLMAGGIVLAAAARAPRAARRRT
jgi:DNA-binding beta-propeller fold protein YncE